MTDELRRQLVGIYGPRLHGGYLFSSYARDDQDDESDLDILIVPNTIPAYGAETDRTSTLIARLSLEYGVSISRVFMSQEDWQHGASAFLHNVRRDAIHMLSQPIAVLAES